LLSALLFGLAASSALVIGGVAGTFWRPPKALVAGALAFASGALITALAFDLFEESFETGGGWFSGVGLLVGAAAFVAADEALGGAVGMRDQGRTAGFVILVWTVTALLLTASVVAGNVVLSGASEGLLAFLLAFAGGAVLASLADTLMPDAYREGGGLVAFATAAGFFLSFMLDKV
jgi:ZIP family zinc transporter